ncbi:MAG: phosphoribosyl-AMP cyclohydrolase [Candidatus Omnitrophica bacterium]|nr:phosphoribosyl-AMP cyclohydrolase [Candidatus Omnitrophota bacterium]
MKSWIDQIKFDENGLVPAVIQDAWTRDVLMVAYMNREAVEKTLRTKKTHFYSRSRRKMWLKGEISGHIQKVKKIALDCDGDCLVVAVTQMGGACHTGYRTCFFRLLKNGRSWKETGRKLFDPDKVYGKGQ